MNINLGKNFSYKFLAILISLILVSCGSIDNPGIGGPPTIPSEDPTQGVVPMTVIPTGEGSPGGGDVEAPGGNQDVQPTLVPDIQEPVDRYIFQKGTPIGLQNFLYPDTLCEWTGVGGQVFGKEGSPITGLIVEVKGILDEQDILKMAMTGDSTAFGEGGYEITLTDHLVDSSNNLTIQVLDLDGEPLSSAFFFDTYANCEKNLVLINFVEITIRSYFYLPFITSP